MWIIAALSALFKGEEPLLNGKGFEVAIMAVSLLIVCASYLIVVAKDRSWINWATPAFFITLGGRYIFQFAYLCLVNPGGSRYAYFMCYTAYALPFLIGVLVYAFVKPVQIRPLLVQIKDVSYWPWVLLIIGFCLYLPVLIEFRAYLAQPRRIYELTRTGYGIWSYGSTTFVNLALIAYLFKKSRPPVASMFFYTILAGVTYLHGSKGLLLNCALIWMLHQVYVKRQAIKAIAAASLLAGAAGLVIVSFAFFSSTTDLANLFDSILSYADYVRLAMSIVDDPNGKRYYGRLNLENDFYGRIPRAIWREKPKDFGPFLLGKIYNSANYRNDEGTGAVDFGEDYADFGPYALVVRCLTSALTGWMISVIVGHLRERRSPSAFIVLVFLAGGSIIPISGLFLLPEYSLMAMAVTLALRVHLCVAKSIHHHSRIA